MRIRPGSLYSKAKTGDAVTSLGKLRPEEAVLVDSKNGNTKVATDLLEIGDIVLINHGTSPPFDGIILDGNTTFDESSLTGESRPVNKGLGDTAYSGTVNKGSSVKVKITTIAGTSMLDQRRKRWLVSVLQRLHCSAIGRWFETSYINHFEIVRISYRPTSSFLLRMSFLGNHISIIR